jgi:formyl-CoA transferase
MAKKTKSKTKAKTKSKARSNDSRPKKSVTRAKTKSPARSSAKPRATKGPVAQPFVSAPAAQDASTGKFLADLAKVAYRAASTSPLAKQVADAALARATEAAEGLAAGIVDTVADKVFGSTRRRHSAEQTGKGLPEPSTKPWGQAGKALDGVRVLDFTHVQSGPTCTQLLGYMGADCIKVERPGVGDITRGQLRDVKGADSLYFTMLNGNKRSITIDSKNPKGKEILERLVKHCDVLVENFAPGALDRMGLSWERVNELNPRMIYASVKGFGPGPYEDCKVYENVAQCAGGSASTTGFRDGPPLVTGAQIGDSGTGLHLAWGIVCAIYQRTRTGRGQRVLCAMQDGVLNLTRVKLRDQQRLKHGPLTEYSQYGEGIPFGDAVPRAGNDSGGGQPGWILKCKGWETDPNAYIYFITQAPVWGAICDLIGKPDWKTDPDYATPPARLPRLKAIFAAIEEWTMTKTKFEVMELCNAVDIPVGPILSMKEIAEEKSLRDTGTVVEVDHPTRGKYLTVGNPVKMSDSITEVQRSPLLGEHTEEILRVLGYTDEDVDEIKTSGAITAPAKPASAEAA